MLRSMSACNAARVTFSFQQFDLPFDMPSFCCTFVAMCEDVAGDDDFTGP